MRDVELLSARCTRVELLKASLRSVLNCGTAEEDTACVVELLNCCRTVSNFLRRRSENR
jgi:hypothetical protein